MPNLSLTFSMLFHFLPSYTLQGLRPKSTSPNIFVGKNMDFPESPNPNLHAHFHSDPCPSELAPSDYLCFGSGGLSEHSPWLETTPVPEQAIPMDLGGSGDPARAANPSIKNGSDVMEGKREAEEGCRIAFRTKSEQEILDDGFRWRKYGKKSVKNSPNPRNYYRCSSGGCNVKKRVERDRDDPTYVITTYDGVHTHPSPTQFVVYNYNYARP